MSYIGVEPTVGTYILLDDISSSFNGVLTEFDAETGGESVTIQNVNQILCAINGVVQEPTDSVQIGSSATKISFTTAPQAGDSFWCVILGDALPVGQVSDASVTTAKLAADAVTGAKIADSAVDTEHLAASAVETAKINNAAVTNAKIADDAVTLQKIQNNAVTVAKIAADALKAIGAVTPAANKIAMFSGTGDATPTLLDFLDEDDMSSDSATAIASQQSIKAFLGSVAIIQYKGTSVETIGTSWTTRVLNTETDPQSFVSLSANQITIPAGTYYIKARAPVQIDNANTSYRSFASRIYDVTNTATLIEMEHAGMRSYEPNGDATQFAMEGEDIVTFASETTIRLETIASVSVSGNGGYYYAASGIDAVQSRVVIQRLG